MIVNFLERVSVDTLKRLHDNRFAMRENGQVDMEQSGKMMLAIGQETMRRMDERGMDRPTGFDEKFS